jgi:hypothetical protein
MEITTLGIDLAKSVFQLHGVADDGVVVVQKKLRRGALLDFLGKLDSCQSGRLGLGGNVMQVRKVPSGLSARKMTSVGPFRSGFVGCSARAASAALALLGWICRSVSPMRACKWRHGAWPTGRPRSYPEEHAESSQWCRTASTPVRLRQLRQAGRPRVVQLCRRRQSG